MAVDRISEYGQNYVITTLSRTTDLISTTSCDLRVKAGVVLFAGETGKILQGMG